MQQLKDQLSQPVADPNKVLFCGKLRIDRDNVTGYLTKGRLKTRLDFFDSLPDRHDFGTVEQMVTAFKAYCNPPIKTN